MPKLPGIGKRIGSRLVEIGFSKSGRPDVGRFCAEKGYRPQYVYAWLAGRTPSYENLQRLASDLGVSRSWLAVGDESEVAVAHQVGADARRPRLAARPPVERERRGNPEPPRARPASPLRLLDFGRLRDVTTKLVQLEAQLAAIFEAFADLYVWVDAAETLLDWKGGRTAVPDVLLGATAGQPIERVFADSAGARLRQAITAALESAQPEMVDYAATVEGVERAFEARVMPIDSPGVPNPQVLVIVRDITDRVRAERAVRDSEAHYRALVEGSIAGICILQAGVVRFANQAVCDIFGYPDPASFIGTPAATCLAPDERPRLAAYHEARRRGEPVPARYEFRGLRADGSVIWLENVVTTIAWDGAPAMLVTLQDVTERRRARDAATALAEVGRQMAAMLDLNEVVQHMLDNVMRLLHVSRAALYRLDPATGILWCLKAAGEERPEELVGRQLLPGEGLLSLAVAQRRPVSSPDVLGESQVAMPEWLLVLNRSRGLSAVMAVPLIVRDQVLGGLVVGDTRGRTYTDAEQALLTAFADQAAVALHNAQRYRELEERLQARERRQG